MTRRGLGVVALVVLLTATVVGCAGEQRSVVGVHPSLRQVRMQEVQRDARLKAERVARLQAMRWSQHGPSIPPLRETGGPHPDAARIALQYLGVPYVWGGASPTGFDASGLVMYVYAQLGISLPHYTVAQWNRTKPISRSHMKRGDLVFFDNLGHVGIYIGNRQFVHAPHTGTVVRISSLAAWRSRFVGARRVP